MGGEGREEGITSAPVPRPPQTMAGVSEAESLPGADLSH